MAVTKCNICLENNSPLVSVLSVDASENNLTALQKLCIVAPFQDWLGCHWICNICNDLLQTSYRFSSICSKYESERLILVQRDQEKNKESYNQRKHKYNSSSMANNSDNIRTHDFPDMRTMDEQMEIITIKIEPELENRTRKDYSKILLELEHNPANQDVDLKQSKCIKCNKMFLNNHNLGIHMSIDHGHKCTTCGKDFRTKGSLGQHNRLEHPKKISCEICGQVFLKPKQLIDHCTVKHFLKNNEVKPYLCDLCEKRFSSWGSLDRHIQYHKGIRNYTCKECGKSFVTKKDVEMHELIHGNEKKFGCKTCGKRFNTLSNMRTHMKCVHLDPSKRKYECYLCSKRFTLKASLEEHIKRHIGLKEHLCMICGATFIAKYDLKRHTYFHTKDRPYKCNLCENKSYRDGKGLGHHIEKCHRVIGACNK